MSAERILYTKPSITEREVALATDAARNGWGVNCYRYITQFETLFKAYVGTKHAIATSSCTGALHIGLASVGVGPGDEVILADTNWIASAAPITYLGAKPVFVDILPDSWCLDPDLIEAAITTRTKAILAVHLYGNMCDLDRISKIGARHGIPVIEDAAEAIGSRLGDRHAGSMGLFGTFSFHGTKTLTTGEGGMLVTNDDALYERALTLSNHGRSRTQTKQFWPDAIGYKYKMSNLQAALGCGQMERIEELVERKREIFEWYRNSLAGLPISMNPERPGTTNGYWMPTIVVETESGVTRDRIIKIFSEENIDGRIFFEPLSSLSMFEPVPSNAIARSIAGRAVNLPSYHDLSCDQMERVAASLRKALRG